MSVEVRKIKLYSTGKYLMKDLAKMFNVSIATISMVKNKKVRKSCH